MPLVLWFYRGKQFILCEYGSKSSFLQSLKGQSRAFFNPVKEGVEFPLKFPYLILRDKVAILIIK